MQTIWIIGGGRFGSTAAERIRGRGSRKKLIVIDKDQDTCRRLSDLNFQTVCMDGIAFLAELAFLNGREKLQGYDMTTLMTF